MTPEWVREAIAKRLKEAAAEAGMKCPQIAKKLSVATATVYRWWEAERIPNEAMMERYAEVTGKEISWIQAGVYQGDLVKDFTEWALSFVRMVRNGMPADEAYNEVTGHPEELSLRERKEFQSSTDLFRRFLANLPKDEASLRTLLELSRYLLKEGK